MIKPVCRKLTLGDYKHARALYGALTTGGSLPDLHEGRIAFGRILTHPGTAILGALDADSVVSMATLHILPNMTYGARPYALIENVATIQTHEGRGFGRAVMQSAAEMAWEADAYKIMLLTGRLNGVKGFYERLGYVASEKHGLVLRRH
ncbi:MAG: GNAT family N-acetyltransferase [Sulfitobacter sp.]